MKDLSKLIIISVFALFGLGLFLSNTYSKFGTTVSAQTGVKPTPTPVAPKATPTPEAPKTTPTPEAPKETATPASNKTGNKTIPDEFVLGKDSFSKYKDVYFNHKTHASLNYSPDGKSVIGCIECHHSDQPPSALKPPLVTSERDVILTMDVFQKSDQKVSLCRACHFQDGEEPDGKEMPFVTYADGEELELNNEIAYHKNCNDCHDAAAKLRPELIGRKGFATKDDCAVCHKVQ